MGYVLESGALLRVVGARPDDPLVRWLEGDGVAPFATLVTAAQAFDAIGNDAERTPAQRAALTERLEALVAALEDAEHPSATAIAMDRGTVRILGDLLGVQEEQEHLGELDLLPAALAVQHNLELVVSENAASWERFADALPEALGRLRLRPFPIEDVA